MKKITLDKQGILEYQKNRDPYLFLDFADEVIPGSSAKGYKDLKKDEWFFKVHWPEDPNMPGMLQIEALVQLAALMVLTLPNHKGKLVYLTSAHNIRLTKKIIPGDRLVMETQMLSWKRGIGKCTGIGKINNQVACKADFDIILPEIVSEFKINNK